MRYKPNNILDKAFPHPLVTVSAEKACVVALLHNDIRDAWLVLSLQTYTGFPNGQQLIIQHLNNRVHLALCIIIEVRHVSIVVLIIYLFIYFNGTF